MSDPVKRQAACSCGKLSVSTTGEPVRVSVCHCLECQKRTGSAFGANARFPVERVAVVGESGVYRRTGDSGSLISFHFCKSCGSTVYWQIDKVPGLMAIAVGAFADPNFPPPRVSVYGQRMHAWIGLPEGIERLD
jgi:hypothetical protein